MAGAGLHEEPAGFRWDALIAWFTLGGIALHLVLRFLLALPPPASEVPLYAVLAAGGTPLVLRLLRNVWAWQFGADLLAGLSILTSILLGEYLVGAIVVLMLSGGTALEEFATRRATSVLQALARRMPQTAHRRRGDSVEDIPLAGVAAGDTLIVYPHEICPVDGVVIEGRGVMDEAYLTGEPFVIPKVPGSGVLSGAVNGETALTIRAEKLAVDSRYARIMQVVHEAEQNRPRVRRVGDRLGALYTPAAVGIAAAGWLVSGDPMRFLAVIVIATPCPLLIAIPVAVIGAISLAAKRGIVVRNPPVLEEIATCRTLIFDKTGTLTYGKPALTHILPAPGFNAMDVLRKAASLERYSKHPLAGAVLNAAQEAGVECDPVAEVREQPGTGLSGLVSGVEVHITGRNKVAGRFSIPPPAAEGMECLVLIAGQYAAALRFHDSPREESGSFVRHLKPLHGVQKVMLVSGDRESEVRYLARMVGITDVSAQCSPEAKVAIVRRETVRAKTIFVGDGINDAPALMVATVGIAVGPNSDVTSEAADAVIMSASLRKVDELLHIGGRMRSIALQSAVGGMFFSIAGMMFAVAGLLPPLTGAIAQEFIDLAAVLNAVRVAIPSRRLTDFA